MLPDRVSNPGPLTYESGALPIALRGPASKMGNNEAKQASVLLRYVPEYICRYPSAYCTI